MQKPLIETATRKPVRKLSVVRNFRRVIEARDMNLMNKELYEFLHLHCGFIAHYDINGFKTTYSEPQDFAEVFIRHFDGGHRYFHGVYRCHEEAYRDTGFTKAEIKLEFFRIVDTHKDSISRWAQKQLREQRYALYLNLKKEFEPEVEGLQYTERR